MEAEMTTDDRKLSEERLERTLNALKIVVSVGEDGRHTVCTEQEPLFCFVRDTEDEVRDLVIQTLRSYVETFYNVENVQFTTRRVASPPRPRAEVLRPISRLIPELTNGFPFGGREVVCV
jgi:hypothetical protein